MIGPHRPPCETPEAQAPERAAARDTRWVLPATILGSSLAFIDSSVVTVALPAIQRELETTLATVQWVVNGYLLTLASLILLGGSAGDRFGRRRAFVVGLVGFAAASLACGLAPSAGWLVAARLAQGAAAALLMPLSLGILGAAYGGEARGPAIGTWAAMGAITTALGPLLGGWLVDTIGWRSIFFINPPLALVALLFARRLPADPGAPAAGALDVRGAALAVAALGSLSFGLVALGAGQRVAGLVALAAAVPAVVIFLLVEARAEAPMMPLSLFRDRRFAGANALTVLLYASLGAAFFLLPFLLIEAHGYSAAAAGAAFLPLSILMGLGSRWTGRLVASTGARLPLIVGPALAAAGYVLLGLSVNEPDYWRGVLPGLLVLGTGMTLSVAPLTTAVLDAAPDERSGTAAGINSAAARAGGLLAVASLGLAFGGSEMAAAGPATLMDAFRLVLFVSAALAMLSALAAAATIEARRGAEAVSPSPGRPRGRQPISPASRKEK